MNETFENWNPRTDLAIEVAANLKEQLEKDTAVEGIVIQTDKHKTLDILITQVTIESEEGAKKLGKPIGSYITIESESMKQNDPEVHEHIISGLAEHLKRILPQKERLNVLVVGLGNRFATPDALGPHVANKVLVTRHLKSEIPEQIDETISELSSFAPGVMGLTGIETSEMIKGVVEHVKPDCVIAIDALAARHIKRINTTIQISTTGISPGAGVGNKRRALNEETIGCPVIAIGVPTVVDAATLVNDTLDHLIEGMLKESEQTDFYEMLKSLSEQEKFSLIKEVLFPHIGNLFVTPKDMDQIMMYLTNIISNAINIAVHPGVMLEDMNKYSY